MIREVAGSTCLLLPMVAKGEDTEKKMMERAGENAGKKKKNKGGRPVKKTT